MRASKPATRLRAAKTAICCSRAKLMAHELELTAGLLSKDANVRLIVSGPIGVKEIERLIKKLEFDKDILAEQSENDEAAN